MVRRFLLIGAFVTAAAARPAAAAPLVPAEDAIRAAIVERLGAGVDVAIVSSGITGRASVFRDARPDPSGWLGRPIRFTLVTGDGAAIPVSVVMTVVGDRVLASHALERGQTITRADLAASRGELSGVPLQRLPTIADLAGGKTLRPIAAGDVVLRGFVAARRTVEPGDRVIATAAAGAVEVSGEFTAADAGAVGDVIRVVNPATKRYLRGRVVKEGHVEVIDGR